jgi:3-dehydroquinate dehydratase / shikimate dehydrogenase
MLRALTDGRSRRSVAVILSGAGRPRASGSPRLSEVVLLTEVDAAAMARERMAASLIATLTTPLTPKLAAGLDGAEWLEVRADVLGDVDPEPLRRLFPGKLLYTLRSRAEGGFFEGSPERRKRRLLEAAARYDRVDLEGARDLAPELLTAVPRELRLISWHGPASDVDALEACFARMATAEAALYKLVPWAVQPGEALAPLMLLHKLQRGDVVAFAGGDAGTWTRLVAPRLGAPIVFGAAGDAPGAPGQPSIRTLCEDFGLPALPPVATLFGVVGNPVAHSLSPRLHNGAYRELGIPALYLPFQTDAFGDFWLEVVEEGVLDTLGLPIHGLSITAPFKAAALAVAGAESPLAGLVGGANTLVLRQGVWEAESTDAEGVVEPLHERGIEVDGRRAAVVGAGGAGRAAAVGLSRAGAKVTIFNRNAERGARAAEELGMEYRGLGELAGALGAGELEMVVNATPVGRGGMGLGAEVSAKSGHAQETSQGRRGEGAPARRGEKAARGEQILRGEQAQEGERAVDEALPFPVDGLRAGTVVIDLVYRRAEEGPTPLLAAAAARGAVTIDGREVLLGQARGQFRLMTGRELPGELARQLLGLPAGA